MRTIRLEILRPGSSDGHLLSPLTPYIAICNDNPPESFTIPFDHQTVVGRLERMRYENGAPAKRADLREAAEIARRVLESIEGFRTTLLNEVRHGDTVNVQLALTAAELALIPFELAYAPLALNGVAPFSVNSSARVSITRETRHYRGTTFGQWNERETRILFVVTAPDGVDVPERAHYYALRKALRYLLPPGSTARMEEKYVTWLRDATLEDLRSACASKRYTHVHILAHGATKDARELEFGLRMNRSGAGGETVDGNRLALALQSFRHPDSGTPVSPAVVTLAVCDSGNVGSVLHGDASLAHRLHEQDIPLVLASQFPMTFQGSAVFVETFYEAMLRGDDPRKVLWKVRDALFARCPDTHDWASVVAYATLPANIASLSKSRMLRWEKLELDEHLAVLEAFSPDGHAANGGETRDGLSTPLAGRMTDDAIEREIDRIETKLRKFTRRASEVQRAEEKLSAISTTGNGYKRLSIACRAANTRLDKESRPILTKLERLFLTKSCLAYSQMFDIMPNEPWVLAQAAVSNLLVDTFDLPVEGTRVPSIREFSEHVCERRLRATREPFEQVDIIAQQIELDLVHLVRAIQRKDAKDASALEGSLSERLARYLRTVDDVLAVRTRGIHFRLYLEARQFRRYAYWWPYPSVIRVVGDSGPVERSAPPGAARARQLLPALRERDVDITRYMGLKHWD